MAAADAAVQAAAQHWSDMIATAERPAIITARDGQLLRLVPASQKLQALAPHVAAALAANPLVHAEAERLGSTAANGKGGRHSVLLPVLPGSLSWEVATRSAHAMRKPLSSAMCRML